MATSDTLAFNPSVSQCIEDAYERCNVQLTSGLSLRTALFSLNILLSEWGNRGIHFWEVWVLYFLGFSYSVVPYCILLLTVVISIVQNRLF